MIHLSGKYTTAEIMIDNIDENCRAQIIQMINNQTFTNPVKIMPDCHSGKGSVVGFTMPVGDKIIPNVVGVDWNCGMLSICLGNIAGFDFLKIDEQIRDKIPFVINVNKKSKFRIDNSLIGVCKRIGIDFDYAIKSLGSLGGGKMIASRP